MLFLILATIISVQASNAYFSYNENPQVLYTGHTSHGLPIYPDLNLSNPRARKTERLN